MSSTIITLPETRDATLCLRLTGMITPGDFNEHFGNHVYRLVDTYGYYNLFIHYDEKFEGWSREAADLSFKCVSQCSPKARRLAYVNAPDSRMLMMKMLQPMMTAETRFFDEDEKDEALKWVLSYKHTE